MQPLPRLNSSRWPLAERRVCTKWPRHEWTDTAQLHLDLQLASRPRCTVSRLMTQRNLTLTLEIFVSRTEPPHTAGSHYDFGHPFGNNKVHKSIHIACSSVSNRCAFLPKKPCSSKQVTASPPGCTIADSRSKSMTWTRSNQECSLADRIYSCI